MDRATISVVLPTYRRPDLLRQCLITLVNQSIPAIEIVVGRREGDIASAEVIAELSTQSGGIVREAVVGPSDNLVCSLNAALSQTSGDLVALTDDDAEFPEDWIERLVPFFKDPTIGGVGGKDIQAVNPGEAEVVGKLQWFGRIIGNHHLGVGPIRDVDVLKGVNCCYRGDLLREIGFDRRLRGRGNVANWELGVCFAFARRGYRLVFDPSLEIIHHTGPRHDGDTNCRGGFNGAAHADAVFNETLLLKEHLPWYGKAGFIAWSVFLGTAGAPGIFQLPRTVAKQRAIRPSLRRLSFTAQGRFKAFWQ